MKSLFWASLLFAYALFGGGLFYCIEKKPEDNKDVYLRLFRELQTNFTNKFNVSINENDFKSFIHRPFGAGPYVTCLSPFLRWLKTQK